MNGGGDMKTNKYYDLAELVYLLNKFIKKDCKLYTICYNEDVVTIKLHETSKHSKHVVTGNIDEALEVMIQIIKGVM